MSTRPVNASRPQTGVPRRQFLKFSVAASGGLLIGFYLPGSGTQASAQESAKRFHAERLRAHRHRRTDHRHREPLRDGTGRLHLAAHVAGR